MRTICRLLLAGAFILILLLSFSSTANAQGISTFFRGNTGFRLKIKQFAIFAGDTTGNHLDSINSGVDLGVVTQISGNVGSYTHVRSNDGVSVVGSVVSGN